jgi:hypothetical protein
VIVGGSGCSANAVKAASLQEGAGGGGGREYALALERPHEAAAGTTLTKVGRGLQWH